MRRRLLLLVAAWTALAHADTRYEAEIQKWRQEREAGLRADGGWLSVAGLFWLKRGPNRFGAAVQNEIVLPRGSAPPLAGVFDHDGKKTIVRVEPGVVVMAKGTPITQMEVKADTSGAPDVLALGRLTLRVIERGGRYAVRLVDNDSPARKAFTGLSWFPVNESYRITARFVPYDPPRPVPVPNVVGQVIEMPSPGRAVFTIGGKEVGLDAVLEEPNATELFYIFRDQTAGKETYPAGRFLYSDLPRDGTVVLDFNKAYSPPCAFTAFATCPLPPRQNVIPARVEAGEKYASTHSR